MLTTTSSRLEWLKFFRNHLEELYMFGEAGLELSQAKNFQERWAILRPVGDHMAPKLDEWFAPSSGGVSTTAISHMTTEAELEAELIMAVRTAMIEDARKHAMAAIVGTTSDDPVAVKALNDKREKAGEEAAKRVEAKALKFDGRWLNAALAAFELFMKIRNMFPAA